jgi:NTE family protein
MVLHATNLLVQRRLADDIVRYRDAAELIVLPPPCPIRVQPMDFGQAESLIQEALDESRRFLAGRLRRSTGDLRPRGKESPLVGAHRA